jgi:hypothetical protein
MLPSLTKVLTAFLALASVAGLAAGCGSSGSTGGPADQFTGTWHYDMVTGPLDCGNDVVSQAPSGNQTFAPGIDSALVDITSSPLDDLTFCNFEFDVAGQVATATPQSCALTGGNAIVTITDWTITLTSAKTADEVAHTTLVVNGSPTPTDPTPTASNCTFTLMAKLTRVAKD